MDTIFNSNSSTGLNVLKLFLVIYGSFLAPQLPVEAIHWLNYVPIKILVLFLVIWTSNHDPALSILLAITFYITLQLLQGKQIRQAIMISRFDDDVAAPSQK